MFSRLPWFTHFLERRLEYIAATYTAGAGAWISMPFSSMTGSMGLEYAGDYLSERTWGVLFLIFGLSSLYALHINGRAWWTPFSRLVTFFLSMMSFAALASAFLASHPESLGTYCLLGSAFLLCGNCVLSAARDAGQEIRRWRGERSDD